MDKVSKVSFNEVMIYEYVIEPRSSGGISAPPKQTISAPSLDVSWDKILLLDVLSWEPKGTPPMPPPQEIRPY